MVQGALRVEFADTAFELLPTPAAYWPAQNTLLVADAHLGKSAAFRASGLAVPEPIADDLDRLDTLLRTTRAERLWFLGDLFHAPEGQTTKIVAALQSWREVHAAVAMAVTRGNHDRRCDASLERCGIEIYDELSVGGLRFVHDPTDADEQSYTVCGHIHPAVRLADKTGSFRLPCFWFGQTVAVLPAFGSFTGTHVIERRPKDRVFAVAEDRVVEV